MKRIAFITIWLVFALITGSLFSLASDKGDKLTPKHLFDIQSVAEVAISPSKELIAYTVNIPRPLDHRPGGDYRELHVVNLKTNEVKKLITGDQSVFSIGWTRSEERRVVK